MRNHRDSLLQNLDSIRQAKILTDEAIKFYSDLFDFQYVNSCGWIEIDLFPSIDDILSLGKEIGSHGIPEIAVEQLQKSAVELGAVIKRHNEGLDPDKTISELSSGRVNIEKVIGLVLKKDFECFSASAQTAGMDLEEYIFLAVNWLKPFFAALSEKSANNDINEYKGNTCPFCGYYPDISVISKSAEGRRYLRCGLCEKLWTYKRIACAVCGSEEAKNLEYFTDEKNVRYRMDACHSCGGYIKTVCLDNAEDINDCDLTVENILSAPLDGLMLQEGFKKL